MNYRPKKCMKCGGMKTYQQGGPTPEQIAAANAEAKRFGMARHLDNAEYLHVGNQVPKYLDAKGRVLDSTYTPVPQQMINKIVPQEVKELEYFSDVNLPGYIDPQSGDIKYVPQSYWHLPRFQQNRSKEVPAPKNLMAGLKYGGYRRMQPGGPMLDIQKSTIDLNKDTPFMKEEPLLQFDALEDAQYKGIIAPMEYFQDPNKTPKPKDKVGFDPFLINYLNAGASALAGMVDRNRQDQYMYNQMSTLGQMNPMPAEQPNPYSLYAKYGGSLKSYKKGGVSLYDYMTSKGMDGSFASRKKMFSNMFDGKYEGTAEQNLKILQTLQANKTPIQNNKGTTSLGLLERPRSASSFFQPIKKDTSAKPKAETNHSPLESGVIVDKRTGEAYIMQGGKPVKKFPVLTGKNVDGNKSFGSVEGSQNSGSATPVGGYMMKGQPSDSKDYDYNILKMQPIQMPGQPFPDVKDGNLAIHQTWSPQEREKLYETDNPYASYGCVNCKKPDMQDVMKRFPQGDTLMVIDSKMPQYQKLSTQLRGKKKKGGRY